MAVNADFFISIWVNSVFSYVQIMVACMHFPQNKFSNIFFKLSVIFGCTGPIYAVERTLIEGYDRNRVLQLVFFIIITCSLFNLGINCVIKQKNFLIEQMFESKEQMDNLKLILDNLEESIMITVNDQIEFLNDKFLEMFVHQIIDIRQDNPSPDQRAGLDQSHKPNQSICAKLSNLVFKKTKNIDKRRPVG